MVLPFHNVTAIVSAGVLGLPSAMADLTWGPGVVVLILSWVITLFTLWQMVELHEVDQPGGKRRRYDRYHELGQRAFGDSLGLWIVIPQQLLVEISVDIVYMVTGGQALRNIYSVNCKDNCRMTDKNVAQNPYASTSLWILIYGSVHFLLVQLPTFNSIAGISLAAAIMSVSYSTIAWAIPAHNRHYHYDIAQNKRLYSNHSYHLPKYGEKYYGGAGSPAQPPMADTAVHVFSAFNALGVMAFAYAGHNVDLEIQATLPSEPGRPSKIAMWRGVLLAYVIVGACYFPVAIVCYWAYGNELAAYSNILQFEGYRGITTAANVMIIIHILGSYQIYAMPVFDMMETVLGKIGKIGPPSFKLRLITRSLYVGLTILVAVILPFFRGLLGFFGGFAFAPTTYFIPCIIWLKVKKPKQFSASWIVNWICIILGVMLMFTATIGGFWELQEQYQSNKSYKTFWDSHKNNK